jgi:hypothetical protein
LTNLRDLEGQYEELAERLRYVPHGAIADGDRRDVADAEFWALAILKLDPYSSLQNADRLVRVPAIPNHGWLAAVDPN